LVKGKVHLPTEKPPSGTQSDKIWNEERAGSMDRALYMGSILFRLENYKPIMTALHDYRFSDSEDDKIAAANDFKTACLTAGLVQEEVNWLWNYLRNYRLDYNEPNVSQWAQVGDGW
jgi:hypothetical protein